jgi:hypothetical protein
MTIESMKAPFLSTFLSGLVPFAQVHEHNVFLIQTSISASVGHFPQPLPKMMFLREEDSLQVNPYSQL